MPPECFDLLRRHGLSRIARLAASPPVTPGWMDRGPLQLSRLFDGVAHADEPISTKELELPDVALSQPLNAGTRRSSSMTSSRGTRLNGAN